MDFLGGHDRTLAEAISRLAYCNPFLPDRIECERQALGEAFVSGGTLWHAAGNPEPPPNVFALRERAGMLSERLAARLAEGARPTPEDLQLYEDVVVYLLFARYDDDFYGLIDERAATQAVSFYRRFREDVERLLQIPRATVVADRDVPHLFATLFQVRRAFHYIFYNIVGNSAPIVRLRAAVWQSIFTRDMRRYRRSLYARMGDVATLISGPSGTGKELVAQAIGLARYIPFDGDKQAFVENFAGSFYALNPSALSPTLIESELFGHRRGAFTGATSDREGLLLTAFRLKGGLLLDDVAELPAAVQPKLLHAVEERSFYPLGSDRMVSIANGGGRGVRLYATSQPGGLANLRPDLRDRLSTCVLELPPLRDRRQDVPVIAVDRLRRTAGPGRHPPLSEAACAVLLTYEWPGNVRQLCNVLDRALALAGGSDLTPDILVRCLDEEHHLEELSNRQAADAPRRPGEFLSLREAESRHIRAALDATGGNVARAARLLGLKRTTLQSRLRHTALNPTH